MRKIYAKVVTYFLLLERFGLDQPKASQKLPTKTIDGAERCRQRCDVLGTSSCPFCQESTARQRYSHFNLSLSILNNWDNSLKL